MDRKSVDSKRQEADKEVLSNAPGGSGWYADADEAVGHEAYVGPVADAVLEVDSYLSVEP
jgi:hypothetical protein